MGGVELEHKLLTFFNVRFADFVAAVREGWEPARPPGLGQ
jgi:hypothetical protein